MKRIIDFGLFLVLGIVGFFAQHALAFGEYEEGYYWCSGSCSQEQRYESLESFLATLNTDLTWRCDPVGPTSCKVQYYFSDGDKWNTVTTAYRAECSSSDTGKWYCEPPPVDCPSEGTSKRIGTAVNGTIENGVFKEEFPEGGFTLGGILSAGGCEYVSPTMLQPGAPGHGTDLNSQVKCTKAGSCFRYYNYVASGQAREAGENEPWSGVAGDPEFPEVPNEQAEASTDTRESRTTTTSTDPITEQVGDTTQSTQTVTTTETRGDGSVVQSQDDITTVTRSDGITRTDTQTTVTTTNADGSKTVETTNNISYTQAPQTIYNIDNSTGRVTVTATGGGTTSQQTRTTEDYNPQGQKVSESTEEGPVTGDDSVKEQQEEETCKTNPLLDKCIGEFKETAKGEFGDIAGKVLDAKEEYMDVFEDVKAQASAKLNFNLSGGGSTSDYVVSFRGVEGNIGITRWFALFDQYDLAALVMAIAALIAVFVILRA